MGLSSIRFLSVGHVAKGETSDQKAHRLRCVDRVDSRSTDHHQCTWLFKGVITALMKRAGGASRLSNRDSRGAIQGVL